MLLMTSTQHVCRLECEGMLWCFCVHHPAVKTAAMSVQILASMQILANKRHPDDAWKALAQLQHAAREALSAAPKDNKPSHAAEAKPMENGTGRFLGLES